MLVTINTDASFDVETGLGAWAFWAVCNEFKITRSGAFEDLCRSSTDAEVKCIIIALAVSLRYAGISKVIINTDSLNAAAILKGDEAHLKKYMKCSLRHWKVVRNAYREVIQERTSKQVVLIEFRHVKAHSGVLDKRSYANEWCNMNARNQLKLLKSK